MTIFTLTFFIPLSLAFGADVNDPRHKKFRHSTAATDGDLLKFLGDDCKRMQLKEFSPLCVKHLSELTQTIDWNYGDAQLATNLQNFCINSKEFPQTHGVTGYKGSPDAACQEFVQDLESARFHELKNGNKEGYKKFCESFYDHHGGSMPIQKPMKAREPEPYKWRSGAFGVSVGFAALAAVLASAL
eukprot:gnl/MRDRNA2_/MRDRNA2_118843_c0_seq1.p1 gnl/MRDRNA2_/MRDRNA2_118843_c0~~gnl/MRDRNA2_/MRDRNA2_118843_c0_seq1.p1  ORF type:complete len:187 (-),score=40.62 gnl/MRDRNA2_/MRDRNA2_118843_c0_seq1:150-710(-)